MQTGVVYPQTEYPGDPAAVRDYAQTVEGLGYSHILAYDHVLGANPERPGGWHGTYTFEHAFHEPFVLFSYMAGVTERIGFTTGVIILPQRQTALAAKQAATLDILSGGRFRMGVGLGWNPVEYEALGQDFHTRGRRLAEQVELMRMLWTKPLVKFQGKWHSIPDAGLNPLPVQRPIPIWFGGTAESALKRAARLGDGWMPNIRKPEDSAAAFEIVMSELERQGKPLGSYGIEARLNWADGNLDNLLATQQKWQELGATCISINTMGSGLKGAREHLAALERFAQAAGI